jgi:phage terminase small subunit
MPQNIKTKLNPKQLLFLQTYLKIGNATKAMQLAGYKTKYPNKIAGRLLENPLIKSAVGKSRQESLAKTQVDFEWVINRLKENALKAINDNNVDASTRALAEINKMLGNYAPEKTQSTHVNIDATLEEVRLLSEQYYNEAQLRIDKD